MEFSLQKTDMRGNTIGEPTKVNVEISQEELEKEMEIYCDCDYLEEHPDENVYYVESTNIPNVGQVNHHGWLCPGCKKYVQVG